MSTVKLKNAMIASDDLIWCLPTCAIVIVAGHMVTIAITAMDATYVVRKVTAMNCYGTLSDAGLLHTARKGVSTPTYGTKNNGSGAAPSTTHLLSMS